MQQDILINWSPQETRVAVVEGGAVQEQEQVPAPQDAPQPEPAMAPMAPAARASWSGVSRAGSMVRVTRVTSVRPSDAARACTPRRMPVAMYCRRASFTILRIIKMARKKLKNFLMLRRVEMFLSRTRSQQN